jgi:hypothetical protein
MPIQHDPTGPKDRQVHLARLEALFTPKTGSAPPSPVSTRSLAKIIATTPIVQDPVKERLLGRLLAAEGSRAVARATSDLEAAGFQVPEDHDVSLRMLEHPDEDRIRRAIQAMERLGEDKLIKRRAVLEARLRRIEDLAEEPETREAARQLRKRAARGR